MASVVAPDGSPFFITEKLLCMSIATPLAKLAGDVVLGDVSFSMLDMGVGHVSIRDLAGWVGGKGGGLDSVLNGVLCLRCFLGPIDKAFELEPDWFKPKVSIGEPMCLWHCQDEPT